MILTERELERLGGTKVIPVNVRLIAATNKDLAEMVEAGSFRMDPADPDGSRVFALARRFFALQTRIMGIRLQVTGREHIDPARTYLIMGNHQSLFDLFVIPSALPGIYTAVEAAYHFSIPLWGNLITRWGCIPIHRRNLEKAKELNDNRAVYRSKLQLDSDLAARSAATARVYSDLGFQQRALVEGWNSVRAWDGGTDGYVHYVDAPCSRRPQVS